MAERFLGCHVSCSGGMVNAVQNAARLEVNTIQFHPSAPQRWNAAAFQSGVEDAFIAAAKDSILKKAFFHAIYLINLASPNAQQQHLSKMSLLHYLNLNHRIGGAGVIVHVGSLKDEPDEKVGFERAAAAINWIMNKTKGEARLILEVAAGAGKVIGDRFEDLAAIYDIIEAKESVGFGLDSQHMWASGYDIKTKLAEVVKEVDSVFGLAKVWSLHLNDSKTERGSKKDRHEDLGQGLIGKDALKALVNHPALHEIPIILETPGLKDEESAAVEVKKLRAYAAGK